MEVAPYRPRRQFDQLRDQIMTSLERVCCRGEFVLGQEVDRFEKEFATYCEAPHAVAVNSGTSALHLALLAAGVGPGHEILTTPLTCAATCEAIAYTGAVPAFVDVDPDTGTLDPTRLAAAWSTRAKAVVPVHLYGFPADLDGIGAFAAATDLSVVDDASHAHGARYRGRRIGSSGRLTIFSLGPDQNLGAYGTGGCGGHQRPRPGPDAARAARPRPVGPAPSRTDRVQLRHGCVGGGRAAGQAASLATLDDTAAHDCGALLRRLGGVPGPDA